MTGQVLDLLADQQSVPGVGVRFSMIETVIGLTRSETSYTTLEVRYKLSLACISIQSNAHSDLLFGIIGTVCNGITVKSGIIYTLVSLLCLLHYCLAHLYPWLNVHMFGCVVGGSARKRDRYTHVRRTAPHLMTNKVQSVVIHRGAVDSDTDYSHSKSRVITV